MAHPSQEWFRWRGADLTLLATIQPGAAQSQFAGLHGAALKIRIHAPPVDGKANRTLIEFLAREFSTPPSRICIVRGATTRTKTVCISAPGTLPANLTALGLTPG
jgi:uncharacterized protein (TIGR00251 family)